MNALQKITKSRAGLVLDHPFFGALVLKLKLIEDPSCETIWTDGESIGYNPTFVDENSISEVKGVLAHDVMHLVLGHHLRMGSRDAPTWNKAADYSVNHILKQSGMVLPVGALNNAEYGEMSVDEVYKQIYIKCDNKGGGGNGPGKGSQGPGQGQGNGSGQGNPSPGQGKADPGGCGEVRLPPASPGNTKPTPSDMGKAENDNNINTAQAAQGAKNVGKLPGFMERLIQELLNPKVNWKDALRDFVDVSAQNDYSWETPDTRYLQSGFYFPALDSKEVGELYVVVDTSGSVKQEDLDQFASEISSIIEEHDTCVLKVVYCDSSVYPDATQTFTQHDCPLELKPKGGGGTRFSPAFEYIDEIADTTPVCVIYLTDLCCRDYPPEPDYPTLWVQTGDWFDGKEVPFGVHIKLEND